MSIVETFRSIFAPASTPEDIRAEEERRKRVEARITTQETFYRGALPLLQTIADRLKGVFPDASYVSPAQWDARVHSISREMETGGDVYHWKEMYRVTKERADRLMHENDAMRLKLRLLGGGETDV
jgi:hypothetical protein